MVRWDMCPSYRGVRIMGCLSYRCFTVPPDDWLNSTRKVVNRYRYMSVLKVKVRILGQKTTHHHHHCSTAVETMKSTRPRQTSRSFIALAQHL